MTSIQRALFTVLVLASFTAGCSSNDNAFGPDPNSAGSPPIATGDRSSLRARRNAWFDQGRQSPDGRSAAEHRLDAIEQAAQLSNATLAFGGPTIPDQWIELGPAPESLPVYSRSSGRISALAVDPNDATGNTIYVGAASGGVWLSTNGAGTSPTFTPLTDATASLATGSIALDPSTSPTTIYVGTGEADDSGDSYYGVGILKSTDGGQNWSLSSSADGGTHPFTGVTFSKVLVDPQAHGATAAIVVACASFAGLPAFGDSPIFGLYRSTNSGSTWSGVPIGGVTNLPCTDLAYDPSTSPPTYYAAFYGNFAQSGVWKSTNQGGSWSQIGNKSQVYSPTAGNGFFRAALTARSGSVWALAADITGINGRLFQANAPSYIWSSPISLPVGFEDQLFYNLFVAAPPSSSALVIGSIDAWSTPSTSSPSWTNLTNAYSGGTVHPDQHAITFAGSGHWYLGNDGGLWRSDDAGVTWNNLNTGIGAIQFTSASPEQAYPLTQTVMGGSQDNGTSKSTSSLLWNMILGGDGGFTATSPINYWQYFTELPQPTTNFLYRFDDKGVVAQAIVDMSTCSGQPFEFYTPYKLQLTAGSASPPKVVFGTDRVWLGSASSSGGPACSTWGTALSPGALSGDPVFALGVTPLTSAFVYASTFGTTAKLFRTASAPTSTTWTNLTPALVTAGLSATSAPPISAIAVHPGFAPGTAYVGVMGFNTPHVFKLSGSSATNITSNLPDAPVNSIVIDPEAPDTNVYVATDVGVFVTTNANATLPTWSQLGTGLPNAPIVEVQLSRMNPRVLVAATHGRGAWMTTPLPVSIAAQVPPGPISAQSARSGQVTFVYDDSIWNIGGKDSGTSALLNDIWRTDENFAWTQSSPTGSVFSPRTLAAGAVFQQKMWIVGGQTGPTTFAVDAWSSNNGTTWTASGAPTFTARSGHKALVFKDKLWVLGGSNPATNAFFNDVHSFDGTTWAPVPQVMPFPARTGFGATVFADKMWVVGGTGAGPSSFTDVWSSSDGQNWSLVRSGAAFGARAWHSVSVWDDGSGAKLWVLGGARPNGTLLNDAWYSSDGVTWTQASFTSAFRARQQHASVTYHNQLWVAFGSGPGIGSGPSSLWMTRAPVYDSIGQPPVLGPSSPLHMGPQWIQGSGAVTFPGPWGAAESLGGTMYFFTGASTLGPPNTVLSSTDGAAWASATADFTPSRMWTASTVFGGQMWIIGGWSPQASGEDGDVWSSPNGTNWTPQTALPAPARHRAKAIAFQGEIWVLGGVNGATSLTDVLHGSGTGPWSIGQPLPFVDFQFGAAAFNGEIWLMRSTGEVWHGNGSSAWTKLPLTTPAAYATSTFTGVPRNFRTVVWDDGGGAKLWVVGEQETWWSMDGVTWKQAYTPSRYPAQVGFATVVNNNRLWLMGGQGSGVTSPNAWRTPF